MKRDGLVGRIRFWIGVVIAGLVVSGITAFPLQSETEWLLDWFSAEPLREMSRSTGLLPWLTIVEKGLQDTNRRYPFLGYGTDWLAFAHLVIAVVFFGPFRDPVRNQWVVTFGLIACAGVVPLALIAGAVREIPFAWRLVDCSFGVLGAIPLLICNRLIRQLEQSGGGYEDRGAAWHLT